MTKRNEKLITISLVMMVISIAFCIGSIIGFNKSIKLMDEKIQIMENMDKERDSMIILTARNIIRLSQNK